jgi:SPP1 family predicted phage head-tail adaptor
MPQSKQYVGELNRRVLFQSPVVTDGTANSDEINSWTDEFYEYAEVQELEGNEVVEGDRTTHVQKVKFTIRYNASVTNRWRIVYGGFAYKILSKVEIGRRMHLKIITEFLDTTST